MNLKGIRLTWLGHATFRIETPDGQILLIDPFLVNNPKCPEHEKKQSRVDVMFCTHGHGDHFSDAVDIAKKHQPKIVGMPELVGWLGSEGAKNTLPMNKGGTQAVADIKVTMVDARHSSGIQDGKKMVYGGEACGYVIAFENGVKIYHAGDTCVFGDMKIIREIYGPQIAMLPIGDHFTMGPREAAYACNLLQPESVIPMHYGTFPQLTGTPAELRKLVRNVEILELLPGQTLS